MSMIQSNADDASFGSERHGELRPAELPSLHVPDFLNYVGVFLTMDCNLGCSYCINDPEQANRRRELFGAKSSSLTPSEWARGLRRIPQSEDLPLTLQGGEPTIYAKGRGLGELLAGIDHRCDLLTNLVLSTEALGRGLDGQIKNLQREAPYPSIRVSWHPDEMLRNWGDNAFETLVERCLALEELGFRVTPEKATSDVGIYMVEVPGHEVSDAMRRSAEGRVPFETKPLLGMHEGELYGEYLYPYSTNLISSGLHAETLEAKCRTTELLLDPMGFAWSCHFYLYESWKHSGPRLAFKQLREHNFQFEAHKQALNFSAFRPVGHILDPQFQIESLHRFHDCNQYGRCIGCDTKLKNNRFQSLENQGQAHTSVEILDIQIPEHLRAAFAEADPRSTVAN